MNIARLYSAPEIFYSLQGEGTSIGCPSIFLRLAGCNLRCHWCDTSYSWLASVKLSIAETLGLIRQHPCQRLVITGGEPLMQQPDIEALLHELPDHYIEIETNGTLIPSPYLQERVNQWNVSPKLAHAGQHDALLLDVLAVYAALPQSWFKFVIQHESDWDEIAPLPLPRERIILMPCATSREQLRLARLPLAELCTRLGVRFGDRLHLELWDKKKGV